MKTVLMMLVAMQLPLGLALATANAAEVTGDVARIDSPAKELVLKVAGAEIVYKNVSQPILDYLKSGDTATLDVDANGVVWTVLALENRIAPAAPPPTKAAVYKDWPFDAAEAKRRQEETAKALGLPVERTLDLAGAAKLKLLLIPAGELIMGRTDQAGQGPKAADEHAVKVFAPYGQEAEKEELGNMHPRHRVRLTTPFYMGATHVTRGQFRRFVEETGYQTDAETGRWSRNGEDYEIGRKGALGGPDHAHYKDWETYSWRNVGFEQTDDHPVVCVSWNDAAAFCRWLSEKSGKAVRLPTEAEWEYACRAGTRTFYFTGDDPETLVGYANVRDQTTTEQDKQRGRFGIKGQDGYVYTSPVGSFKPNAFGLYDMHGNAAQWCQDFFGSYLTAGTEDPQGRTSAIYTHGRVFRGGSWNKLPGFATSYRRECDDPWFRDWNLGFRICMNMADSPKPEYASPPEARPTSSAGRATSSAGPAEAAASAASKEPAMPITDVGGKRLDDAASPAAKVAQTPTGTQWPFDGADAKRLQQETAKALRLPAEMVLNMNGDVKLKLVLIPAGEFWMGNSFTKEQDTEAMIEVSGQYPRLPYGCSMSYPVHRVRITRPFYLGATAVTRGQFRQFIDETGYQADKLYPESVKAGGGGMNRGGQSWPAGKEGRPETYQNWLHPEFVPAPDGYEQTDDHPVVNVCQLDGKAFCAWLSGKTGRAFRLPTNAQWEWSCRAGTDTRWFTGNDPKSLLGYANIPAHQLGKDVDDGYKYTAPVASFKPNAFGLYDMNGNSWNWTRDGWDYYYYMYCPTDDPCCLASGAMMRAAAYNSSIFFGRSGCSDCGDNGDHHRGRGCGFRVALYVLDEPMNGQANREEPQPAPAGNR